MPKRPSQRTDRLRRALAEEAARIMAEHGIEDYLQAKRKAAARLGVNDRAVLPRNIEIETALYERQQLFAADAHARRLARLRHAAKDAMVLLSEFEPRLVGSVLSGTVTEHSEIDLHLFADAIEVVSLKLIDQRIPHQVGENRVRFNATKPVSFPSVRFSAGEMPIDATVFPPDGVRQAPRSPVDGRPMRRARLAEVEQLLATGKQL